MSQNHASGFGNVRFEPVRRLGADTVLFASIIGGVAVLVGLRGPFTDPQGAWWSIATVLTMCGLAAALHWMTLRRAYLYAAGILLNLSLSIWLIKYRGHQVDDLAAFVKANIIALSLAGVVWLMLELRQGVSNQA
jgi:hypothetical protein